MRTEYVDDAVLHVPASGVDVSHHIVAATRRIPSVNMTPCAPLVSHSPEDPDLEEVNRDQQPWDIAATPVLDSLTQSGTVGRG